MKALCTAAFIFFVATGTARAQGVGASGDVIGAITDPAGAAVANATVTATDAEKGIKRTATSDEQGRYRIAGLAPSVYSVSVSRSGFQTQIRKDVVVNVGETVTLDFRLKVSQVSESVEVTTEAPVVEVDRGHQADTITEKYIDDLPINRRDYLSFTLLLPAVADGQTTAGTDFHVRQTPTTGLSFYGGDGRGVNVTVDGGEFNGDSGGVNVNLSQDAVQEFQINMTNYGADLGSARGASVNIVSKSGTNELHGTVYGFFRNDAMDARNPFAFTNALPVGALSAATGFTLNAVSQPTKDTLSRQQYGATLGFPVKKDKTFLFFSYEGLRDHEQTAVPLLTNSNIFAPDSSSANDQQQILNGLAALGGTPVPCLTGQPALPAATCAAILQNVLTINPASSPLSRYLVNEFESNGGLFPFSTIANYFSGRLDHAFNDNNQAYLRYLYGLNDTANPNVGALQGISRGSSIKQWNSALQAAWFHQFSPKTQNEFRAQWSLIDFNVYTNDPGGPELDIGAFQLGRDRTLPDFTTLRQYEFTDNLTLIRGRHSMKMGFYEEIRGDRTSSATFLSGDFNFGPLPGGILSPCLQVPAACGLAGVTPATLNALQSFSLGLPTFYQQGFANPALGGPTTVTNLPLTAFYWQDSWAIASNFTLNYGLRYELDSRYVLQTDTLNFAPRVSFAWDPFKDHKTVIRGGAGLYYAPDYIQIDFSTKELSVVNGVGPQIPNFLIPLTGEIGNPAVTSAAIFQTLFAAGLLGAGGFPNNPCNLSGGPAGAGSGACITQAALAAHGFSSLSGFPDFFSIPQNFHNAYSEQASLGIEHQLGHDMSISASGIYVHTLRLPVTVNVNLLPTAPTVSGIPGTNGLPFQNWNSQFSPQCALIVNNPCVMNPLIVGNNTYQSNGSAVYAGGILEFKKRFSQHFTMLANYTWSKAIDNVTDFNISYAAQNETSLAADRGLSTFDQRHKFTLAGVIGSPWKQYVLSGFEFSPIVRYNSGHPFNLLAGSDVNGDNNSLTDRPPGAGRDTGIGPNYVDFDGRLSWRGKIAEKNSLQFTVEAFNLFNHTNYAGVNNVVGPNFAPPFNVNGTNAVSPGAPLGFTAAYPKRQLQLGARFVF